MIPLVTFKKSTLDQHETGFEAGSSFTSLFTRPHDIPNLCDFPLWNTKEEVQQVLFSIEQKWKNVLHMTCA